MSFTKDKIEISVVTACYNESSNIFALTSALEQVLDSFNYEIIFVNDGSNDDTAKQIETQTKRNNKITLINLSKNQGQQKALKTGIDKAKGEYILTMDCDLQHTPALIPKLYSKCKEGYSVVNTITIYTHKTSVGKRITAKCFYWLLNLSSKHKIVPGLSDFRLFDSKLLDELNKIDQKGLFLRGAFSQINCKQSYLEYNPETRFSGKSKYTTTKMVKLAISAFSNFSIIKR